MEPGGRYEAPRGAGEPRRQPMGDPFAAEDDAEEALAVEHLRPLMQSPHQVHRQPGRSGGCGADGRRRRDCGYRMRCRRTSGADLVATGRRTAARSLPLRIRALASVPGR